jgi:hypothetical protein
LLEEELFLNWLRDDLFFESLNFWITSIFF